MCQGLRPLATVQPWKDHVDIRDPRNRKIYAPHSSNFHQYYERTDRPLTSTNESNATLGDTCSNNTDNNIIEVVEATTERQILEQPRSGKKKRPLRKSAILTDEEVKKQR